MNFQALLQTVDRRFLLFDTTARLPAAMFPLGMLLYVAASSGSYASAGLAVGALSVGGALGGPVVGVAADRIGQRPVAVAATVVQVGALAAFLVADDLSVLLGLAALTGFANPQVGAMARSRWAVLSRTRARRHSLVAHAMAFEGAVDEASFVVGPVLVATLAGVVDPRAGLLTALVIAAVAQSGFALHSSALPGHPPPTGRRPGRVEVAHLSWLLLALTGVGVVFGISQTGVAALMDRDGTQELTGLVYAAMGVGSAVTGLLTPRLPARWSLVHRIVLSGLGLVGAGVLMSWATGPASLAAACLATGVALAPALISAYAAAERATPPGRGTTVMTALSTANVVGVAIGAGVAGQVIERAGIGVALLLVAAAGLVVLAGGLGAGLTEPPERPATVEERSGARGRATVDEGTPDSSPGAGAGLGPQHR